MATTIRGARPRHTKHSHDMQEQLLLAASRLHRQTDWERLMEQGTTPALVIGGERRVKRKA